MRRNFFAILLSLLLIVQFPGNSQTTSLNYKDYRIEKSATVDSDLVKMLQPYAASLNASMNKVIGFANTNLSARRPESPIGNFMADCMKLMAEKKFGRKVDAAFINPGGIRSYIPKGNITVGKIFELMPFDNLIVLQEVKGNVLKQFLDKTAADGGWPVSIGTVLSIKDKKTEQLTIDGKPLNENATYLIANTDYIANGGDDCDMLRGIRRIDKGYLFRDALIGYITELTQQGKPVEAKVENRVSYAN
jgi:2',3'-cyclic-nucleotide 2'-phosphodiesterase (5'-nucleotidase family)